MAGAGVHWQCDGRAEHGSAPGHYIAIARPRNISHDGRAMAEQWPSQTTPKGAANFRPPIVNNTIDGVRHIGMVGLIAG